MDIRGAGPACPRFQETVLTLGGSVPLLPLTNSSPCAARGQGPPSEALLRRDAWGGHVGPCFCWGLIFCYVFVWVSFWSDPCLSRCCPSATATRTAGVFCSLCGSGVRPCSPPRPLSHAAPFRFRTHARPFASASSCLCGAARDHPRATCGLLDQRPWARSCPCRTLQWATRAWSGDPSVGRCLQHPGVPAGENQERQIGPEHKVHVCP